MSISPRVKTAIQHYIEGCLQTNNTTVHELLDHYHGKLRITEAEMRRVIREGIDNGYISILNGYGDDAVICLKRPFDSLNEATSIRIVVSRPAWDSESLGTFIDREDIIDTKECFSEIVQSAHNTLRISSPFVESNIVNVDVFSDLKMLLRNAFDRGVEIHFLSRELEKKQAVKIAWLTEIADEMSCEGLLEVRDYHGVRDRHVKSSLHAKLLIADREIAYVGSAELRKNSLSTNFEVGCMLYGSAVYSLCEVFDAMFECGVKV